MQEETRANRYLVPRGDEPYESLLEIKRSEFIGHIKRVSTVEEARAYIDSVRKTYHDARHVCSAFIIGADRDIQRSSDDGEPAGTAGVPMMQALLVRQTREDGTTDLSDVVAVVVRYFGGTLLGVPGLIHAYKEATAQALAVAEVVEKNIEKTVWLKCEYPFLNEAIRIAKQYQADILEQDLQLDCRLTVNLSLANYEACVLAWKNTRQIEVNTEKPFE